MRVAFAADHAGAAFKDDKAAVLAVDAGKSLMFNREEMLKEADRAGIAVWGI